MDEIPNMPEDITRKALKRKLQIEKHIIRGSNLAKKIFEIKTKEFLDVFYPTK